MEPKYSYRIHWINFNVEGDRRARLEYCLPTDPDMEYSFFSAGILQLTAPSRSKAVAQFMKKSLLKKVKCFFFWPLSLQGQNHCDKSNRSD